MPANTIQPVSSDTVVSLLNTGNPDPSTLSLTTPGLYQVSYSASLSSSDGAGHYIQAGLLNSGGTTFLNGSTSSLNVVPNTVNQTGNSVLVCSNGTNTVQLGLLSPGSSSGVYVDLASLEAVRIGDC